MGNWVLVVVLVVGILAIGCAPKPAPTPAGGGHEAYEVRAYTAPVGTSAYCLYVALEDICDKYHPWIKFSAIEGAGGTANAHALIAADTEEKKHLVMLLNPPDYLRASQGLPPFESEQTDDLRFLHALTLVSGTMLTLDPNIKSIEDLEGKKVALGKPTQSFWGTTAAELLEYGFGLKDGENITIEWVGDSAGGTAMKDGLVDAAFMGGYGREVYAARDPLLELASTVKNVHYLDATEDACQKAAVNNPVFPLLIPAGTLPGNQPDDIYMIAMSVTFFVDKSFPDEVAYELVKLMMDHYQEFGDYHAIGKTFTSPSFAYYAPWIEDVDKVMHPGALNAFREAGMKS